MPIRTVYMALMVLGLGLASSCGGRQPSPVSEPTPVPPASISVPPTEPPLVTPEAPQKRDSGGSAREKAAPRPVGPGMGARPPDSPAAVPPPAPSPAPADPKAAKERALEAVRLLAQGEVEPARAELAAALRHDPGNELAADLLQQIDADPEAMLGKEHFSYVTAPGDTLSKIAKKYLNDPYKFYILARYNGISNPSDLHVGQTIRVPGRRPAAPPAPPPAATQAPKPSPPPKPPPAAPKLSEGDQAAERYYQSGLQALSAGSVEKAHGLFTQALQANPKHPQAQAKIREIRPRLADVYYRNALAASRRQDLEGTIRNCDKVLEIDPENEKAKLLRAQALDLQERMKKIQ